MCCYINGRSQNEFLSRGNKGGHSLERSAAGLKVEVQKPIEIFVDNQPCIALSKQFIHYGKTKHFALKLHSIRELVEKGELELKYLQTDLMIANVLTNRLGKTKHARFCAALLGDTQPERRGEGSQD